MRRCRCLNNLLSFVQGVGCLSWTCRSQTALTMATSSMMQGHQRKDAGSETLCGDSTSPFERLNFDNVALRTLAIDSIEDNYVRKVAGAFFSKVKPVPVENPAMVAFSASAARLIDLESPSLERAEAAEYFVGNRLFPGSDPAAHCYCGHQFGHFAGQLGDGAAMYLGEVVNLSGERWELQLKGAGPTPYSRDADGRKVLRSSIREFLCSEAMYHLNIPTTRAATCVTSDAKVVRDVFYSGNPIMEKCTIVSRLAPTFLRFGSFEIFKTLDPLTGGLGPSVGRNDLLRQLLDYTISSFFPEIHSLHSDDPQTMFAEFYREVVKRTARLVADWQCVGFCHGVLNTDNMSVVGLTIDYGPFGFLDQFNPNHVCNGSDDGGRYSFTNQPKVCGWNLTKFAEALQVFLPLDISSSILDDTYFDEFNMHFARTMRRKFGLIQKEMDEDRQLIEDFLETMAETGADFTLSFRSLSQIMLPGSDDAQSSLESVKGILLKCCCTVEQLKSIQQPTMSESQFAVYAVLLTQHPELLERLGRGAETIEKELEKRKKFAAMSNLSAEDKSAQDDKLWTVWLEKYTSRLRLEVNEADDLPELNFNRRKVMNASNPRFVLRNYMAQVAIEAAEKGDFSETRKLLAILENPFADAEITPSTIPTDGGGACRNVDSYDLPPDWAKKLRVTCSS